MSEMKRGLGGRELRMRTAEVNMIKKHYIHVKLSKN